RVPCSRPTILYTPAVCRPRDDARHHPVAHCRRTPRPPVGTRTSAIVAPTQHRRRRSDPTTCSLAVCSPHPAVDTPSGGWDNDAETNDLPSSTWRGSTRVPRQREGVT